MPENDRIATLRAQLAEVLAAQAPTPVVFTAGPTDDEHAAATRREQPRSARRSASPIRTR